MKFFDAWTAFLVMLFLIVGLCGLFASYAISLPLERSIARQALLDDAVAASAAPDAQQRILALRPRLGSLADSVLDGAGPLPDRIATARRVVVDEQRRESASIGFRVRLMLGIVTAISATLGAGLMAISKRGALQAGEERAAGDAKCVST